MIEGEPLGCLLGWPRGSLRQWLVALGTLAALIGLLYLLLSYLGL